MATIEATEILASSGLLPALPCRYNFNDLLHQTTNYSAKSPMTAATTAISTKSLSLRSPHLKMYYESKEAALATQTCFARCAKAQ